MKLYLAGPMSGIPQFNYPAFFSAAEYLREQGYEVHCPAEMDSPEAQEAALASPNGDFSELRAGGCEETWGDFLREDVKIIADEVDGVCLMPGWANSRGARLEAFVCLTVQKELHFVNKNPGGFWQLWPIATKDALDAITNGVEFQGDTSRYEV